MPKRNKLTWKKFKELADRLAKQIKRSKIKFDAIDPIPRGGYILAVLLSHKTGIPLLHEYAFTKNTTRFHKAFKILVVDEEWITGRTANEYMYQGDKFACMFFNPKKNKFRNKPDFYVELTNKDFIYPWEY